MQNGIQLSKKQKIIVSIIFATLLLIIVGFGAYKTFVFQISSISPNPSNFPSSVRTATFTLNRNIRDDQNLTDHINIEPNMAYSVTKKSPNSFDVSLLDEQEAGSSFVVTIKSLVAVDGQTLDVATKFNVRYVDFNNLKQDEQQRQTTESDSFEGDFKLVEVLPYSTNNYDIDYQFPYIGQTKMPIVVTMNFGVDSDPKTGLPTNATRTQYLDKIKKFRAEAVAYLNKNGYDANKYDLLFAEPELVNEFGGEYVGNYFVGD